MAVVMSVTVVAVAVVLVPGLDAVDGADEGVSVFEHPAASAATAMTHKRARIAIERMTL